MATKLEHFDSWLSEIKKPKWNHREVCIAEDTWIAALEWVMKQHYLYYSSYTFKIIEKELEEEKK